jgi:hypothetical protein
MRLQIASDLHLEFYKGNAQKYKKLLKPVEGVDVLVLAGDIGYPEDEITKEFLKWCCENWKKVFWIFGNHEYYSKGCMTMKEKEEKALQLEKEILGLNVSVPSERKELVFPGVRIVGATLWSELVYKDVVHSISDFRYIWNEEKNLSFDDYNLFHKRDKQYLEETILAHPNESIVVVTHHLPSYKMILPQFDESPVNEAFASHCERLIGHENVLTWICGHSHGSNQVKIEKVSNDFYMVMNSRGYPGEACNRTFNPSYVMEIEQYFVSLPVPSSSSEVPQILEPPQEGEELLEFQ